MILTENVPFAKLSSCEVEKILVMARRQALRLVKVVKTVAYHLLGHSLTGEALTS